MHTYNLRFAPATTPEQRAVYDTLYPLMAAHRDKVVKAADGSGPAAAQVRNHPTDFFQGMQLEHLEGSKPTPTPPAPAPAPK
jgi:hypothetical protein